MNIKTIHYCRLHDNCDKGVILCCRVCPRNMQCKDHCLNHPENCKCSTKVCCTDE